MRGAGHHITGLAAGIAVAPLFSPDTVFHVIMALAAWSGGTAPDWLELPYSKNGGRVSFIPHRRITHWALAWVLGLAAAVHYLPGTAAYPFVAGFAVGGCTHWLMDIPNPAGVPLLHPWQRTSLHLWRSGDYELTIMLLFSLGAWLSYRTVWHL